MKRFLALTIALMMLLSLAGCTSSGGNEPAQPASEPAQTASEPAQTETPAADAQGTSAEPSAPAPTGGIAAENGTLTISQADVAVVVNGTPVAMPYNLGELEAAGVPADESRSGITLSPGDFFSANLYLDENEDYLLIPAYYNGKDSAVSMAEAEAEEITMTTYADDPVDQGVSILGVAFGMPRSDVKAMLGEPVYDAGDYLEWHVEIPDMAYEGTLSMYFTEDSDDGKVSQVDLTVFEK